MGWAGVGGREEGGMPSNTHATWRFGRGGRGFSCSDIRADVIPVLQCDRPLSSIKPFCCSIDMNAISLSHTTRGFEWGVAMRVGDSFLPVERSHTDS